MEECKLSDDGDDDHNLYEHIKLVELNTRHIKAIELVVPHIMFIYTVVVYIMAEHIVAECIKVTHIEAGHTEVKAKSSFNNLMEDILTIDKQEAINIIQEDTMVAAVVDISQVDN